MCPQRGAAASTGHRVGTSTQGCALFWHTTTSDGAERAAPSSHLRDSHTLGTGSGTVTAGAGHGVGSGGRKEDVCAATGTWTALEGKT